MNVAQWSLYRLIKKFQQTTKYADLHRRKQEKKVMQEMAIVINNELE